MKSLYFKKSIALGKLYLILSVFNILFFFSLFAMVSPVSAQAVLFDFDNAQIQSPLPFNQTVGGITAHFSATGQGYSIQNANTMGFTPQGFAGLCIYPSSIYLADLLINFDQTLTDFSIMYSCQELGCDDAATMRVTAYMNGSLVGTNLKTTSLPGTWPVDTLFFSFPLGFDSIVVHYDSHPPTCQDYGVIFLADNMWVTPYNATEISNQNIFIEELIISNPVTQLPTITFSLFQTENINITIYDITGKLIKNLFYGHLNKGKHQINWSINDNAINNGVFYLNITGKSFSRSFKFVVIN
jgi:hypothetical protein